MNNLYDVDVIAWAEQQASLLRAGKWTQLDIDNIAEEIEDVGKSEKRELRHRLAVLLEHLAKWRYQPDHRRSSWLTTIRVQRLDILTLVRKVPSLRRLIADREFAEGVWRDAVVLAVKETQSVQFPLECPWTLDQALAADFLPDP